MADFTLTEGDIVDVPAAAAPKRVISPNAGQRGYRGTLWNKGAYTVYFLWNPTTAEIAGAAAAMVAQGIDTTEKTRKGYVEANSAIRIPSMVKEFLCCCASTNTSKLMHVADGAN